MRSFVMFALFLLSARVCLAFPCDPGNWEDYAPILYFNPEHTPSAPIEATAVDHASNWVENNWEDYRGNEPMSMTVNVVHDSDPWFACDQNPDGEFAVFQYHYYFPINYWECPLQSHNHEHDWEWAYVVVTYWGDEVQPVAVSYSGHDDNNHVSPIAFYPNLDPEPTGHNAGNLVEVFGDRPILYVTCGNALTNRGEPGDTAQFDGIVGDPLGHFLSYTSCDGELTNVITHKMAYGVTGEQECDDTRDPPWERGHWNDPFRQGQFGTGAPLSNRCNDWLARCACVAQRRWADIRLCFLGWSGHRLEFGSNASFRERPQGTWFGAGVGDRVFWPHFDRRLADYSLRAEDHIGGVTTHPAQPDSERVVVRNDSNHSRRYQILGNNAQFELKHTDRASSEILGHVGGGVQSLDVLCMDAVGSAPGAEPTLLVTVEVDGYVRIYDIADLNMVNMVSEYDLSDWIVLDHSTDYPEAVTAEWVSVGAVGGGREDRLAVVLSRHFGGSMLLDATDVHAVTFDSVTWDSYESVFGTTADMVLWATPENGIVVSRMELDSNASLMATTLNEWTPQSDAVCYSIRGAEPGYVAAAFTTSAWGGKSRVYRVHNYGSLLTEIGVFETPPEYEDEDVIEHWFLADLDEGSDLAIFADKRSGYSAIVDWSSGEWVSYGRNEQMYSNRGLGGAYWLDGGRFLSMGATRTSGPQGLRTWGTAEVRKLEFDGNIKFVQAIAEEGFDVGVGPSRYASAAIPIWRDGKRMILTSQRDSGDASGQRTDALFTLYYGVDDLPTVQVEPVQQAEITRLSLISRTRNPFVEDHEFVLSVPSSRPSVAVSIFSVDGRLVKDLYGGALDEGQHFFKWNGRDADGRSVENGVYMLRVNTGEDRLAKKLVVLR